MEKKNSIVNMIQLVLRERKEGGKEESMEDTLYVFKFELDSGITNERLMEF